MIIVKYLTRETIKSQLAVFFILFLVFLSQRFISVLADASDGDIPARLILSIVSLNMPGMGLLMLPLSLYIGILVTFGRLYAESEITVMNATGIGNRFLIQAALILALITSLLAAGNSFFLAPWSQNKEAQLLEQVASENTVDLLQKGKFQRSPDGTVVVFVDDIRNKKLNNIFVIQRVPRDSLRPSVLFSHSGIVKELSDGRQILTLEDGTRYEGIPSRLDYMTTTFDSYDAVIGQRKVKSKQRKWEARSTLELFHSDDLGAKAELQWRVALVLCIPFLVMVVVPLSAVNPRQGRFAKMGPAILIYLAYFLSISAMKSAVEDGSIHPYTMWTGNILLFITGIIMNSLDSLPVRRLKDKFRKKKLAKV